jgi:5-methylcytosine-specific restriction protein A
MKLRTLKSRLQAAPAPLVTAQPVTVERKRGSAGVKDRNKIKVRDAWLCQQCKAEGRSVVGEVVDHRTPLWAGGSDEDRNKWLLCIPCHDVKTAREASERGRAAGY